MRAKINALDARLPVRYSFFMLCAFGFLLAAFSVIVFDVGWAMLLLFGLLTGVGVHDLKQTRHAILRNYPVIGHLRFLFEFVRPEIRQYFIESDSEAAPFSRAQRSLVYQRAKGEPDNQPFGTHLDVGKQGYEWVNHSMSPTKLAILPSISSPAYSKSSPGVKPSASHSGHQIAPDRATLVYIHFDGERTGSRGLLICVMVVGC